MTNITRVTAQSDFHHVFVFIAAPFALFPAGKQRRPADRAQGRENIGLSRFSGRRSSAHSKAGLSVSAVSKPKALQVRV
jgi:hypothetical protein